MTNREEIIWAAGLFEGEGCIAIERQKHRNGYCFPRMSLCTTDPDVLIRFQQATGIGGIGKPYMGHKSTKPVQQWWARGFMKTQAIIAMFWPWLGERRRAKAKEVLALARSNPRQRNLYLVKCSQSGCASPPEALGLCHRHYLSRWQKANRDKCNRYQQANRAKHKSTPDSGRYLTQ